MGHPRLARVLQKVFGSIHLKPDTLNLKYVIFSTFKRISHHRHLSRDRAAPHDPEQSGRLYELAAWYESAGAGNKTPTKHGMNEPVENGIHRTTHF